MTPALRRLHRGLLAVMVLSLVVTLCPCLSCAQMTADDCCASEGTSIGGACCVSEGGSRTAPPATASVAAPAGPAAPHPLALAAATAPPIHPIAVPTRPVVARAVLRI